MILEDPCAFASKAYGKVLRFSAGGRSQVRSGVVAKTLGRSSLFKKQVL